MTAKFNGHSLDIKALQSLCGSLRSIFGTEQLIIAGGAVADTVAGVEVKDIDVFLRMPPFAEDEFRSKVKVAAAWLADLRDVPIERVNVKNFDTNQDSGGELLDVAELQLEGEPTIQLMQLAEDPVDDVHNYDVCQRQQFVTPNGHFSTEAAIADRAGGTITYNDIPRDPASFARSVRRYQRLKDKYPGRRFVGFEKHEEQIAASIIAGEEFA